MGQSDAHGDEVRHSTRPRHDPKRALKFRIRGTPRDMSLANVTKGMCSRRMGNMCPTRTRVCMNWGSHERALSATVCPPLDHRPSVGQSDPSLHRTPTLEETRWGVIQPRRRQLTRDAPLWGPKDDICTWCNFVNNGSSADSKLSRVCCGKDLS